MARYYVKVVADGDNFRVLANLPSGVFSSEPMPEREAMAMAAMLERTAMKSKPSLWKRIWGWWKGTSPGVPSPPPETPTCSRHPQWAAEWAGGKWVCSFCRKELKGNVETVRG